MYSSTQVGQEHILNIKKSILKKKIMLSVIIDSYSFRSTILRWTINLIGATSPAISGLDRIITGNTNATSTATIVIGAIVLGLFQLSSYLQFDQIRDVAKTQSYKYTQLYERVLREETKTVDKRQAEEDFIYWINREYNSIEVNDPELSITEKEKYKSILADKNIPEDDDLEALQILVEKSRASESNGVSPRVDYTSEHEEKTNVTYNSNINNKQNNYTTESIDNNSKNMEIKQVKFEKAIQQSTNPLSPVPDRKTKLTYQNTIKKMDPFVERAAALERLANLKDNDSITD